MNIPQVKKNYLPYSTLGKAFEKKAKTTEDQGEKQIKSIKYNKKRLDN